MSAENKAIVRRLFQEVWNKGNLALADQIIAAHWVNHDPATPDTGRGPEGYKKLVSAYRGAFPDIQLKIEDLFADGNIVVARYSASGTHRGELKGIAPTGRRVRGIPGHSDLAHFARKSRGQLGRLGRSGSAATARRSTGRCGCRMIRLVAPR